MTLNIKYSMYIISEVIIYCSWAALLWYGSYRGKRRHQFAL